MLVNSIRTNILIVDIFTRRKRIKVKAEIIQLEQIKFVSGNYLIQANTS